MSEVQDISLLARIICNTYQEVISQCWNGIQPYLNEETAVSHMQMEWFFILTSRKIMTEIAIHPQTLATSQSHAVVANCLGVPPTLCMFFTYIYASIPTL